MGRCSDYMKYIASVSFGKDSLAMLLRLIEEGNPIDEVVYFDTGMEFGCIYNVMNKIQDLLRKNQVKFTTLRSKSFINLMFDHEIHHKNGTVSRGYKWCGGVCRWYTSEKTRTIKKYLKKEYGSDYKEYVGIAYDEPKRIDRALEKG